MVTLKAASISRRFSSSEPQRFASLSLSGGSNVKFVEFEAAFLTRRVARSELTEFL